MRVVLNIIWLLFGGLWPARGYLVAALVCFLLIVTIPFGFAPDHVDHAHDWAHAPARVRS